jgi:hypothetical protein
MLCRRPLWISWSLAIDSFIFGSSKVASGLAIDKALNKKRMEALDAYLEH